MIFLGVSLNSYLSITEIDRRDDERISIESYLNFLIFIFIISSMFILINYRKKHDSNQPNPLFSYKNVHQLFLCYHDNLQQQP